MLKITIDGMDAILTGLAEQPAAIQRASVRAINRGIKSARTFMARSISEDTSLKVSYVREQLRMRLATGAQPTAELAASAKRIPLVQFNARGPEPSRGRGRGVAYRLPGSHAGGRLEQAFLATMRSGHRGVFRRSGRGRLPIQELFGPSLGHVFIKYQVAGQDRALEMFQKNFGHELEIESKGFVKAGPDEQGTPDESDVAA